MSTHEVEELRSLNSWGHFSNAGEILRLQDVLKAAIPALEDVVLLGSS